MNTWSSFTRRDWLRWTAAGVGASVSGWFGQLAADAAADTSRKHACILLWMSGGPSQLDTFDPKPGQPTGGPFRPIASTVPGMQLGEHLPRLARLAEHLAVIRSLTSSEGDHARATYHLRTGYRRQGPVQYPPLGALVANELADARAALPGFVSIAPARAVSPTTYGAGFLGPQNAPLLVGAETDPLKIDPDGIPNLRVNDLARAGDIGEQQAAARMELWRSLEQDFTTHHPGFGPQSHRSAYERALRLMQPAAARAFDLDDEPAAVRDAYGRTLFGQGCLLARRLVERGVPFVEVTLGGWDTHVENFDHVARRCAVLDPAWASLLADLKQRGLLDSTLVVWMGEFGRTPQINGQAGRDHFPTAWSAVLAGAIRGGQVVGRTSKDGTSVEDRPIKVPDFMATICRALGLDPTRSNLSNVGRPIRLADAGARPVEEVLR
jgi:hypothetical protein